VRNSLYRWRPRRARFTTTTSSLALYVCYELHYRSFEGVDPLWEWDPVLLKARGRLEDIFEHALRDAIDVDLVPADGVEAELRRLVKEDGGPPLARFLRAGGRPLPVP